MKKLLVFAVLLSATAAFSQTKTHPCSKVKSKKSQLKSNTLSVAQIAETEKYDVHFYALDLNMTNTSTFVDGNVEIHAKTRVDLDSALFELFDTFTITDILVNGSSVSYFRSASRIKVPVNQLANTNFVIKVIYNGTPPDASSNPLGGSGMTNDNSPSWGNQVTWSLSEAFSAFEWFPCKQSLTDKADSVSFICTVPSTCKAGSNGVLIEELDLGNGFTKFHWFHRKPIDYYLISIAVAEYIDYTVYANPVGAVNPVPVVNYVYNNPQTLPNFQADIDETVDFIEFFSTVYGTYPFYEEKYGHCMAPLGGGMEHQTMTTQGWFDKTLTAHELGHQWWGDQVTCKSWADIWVNEGFASYSEYLMLEELYPGEEVAQMNDQHANVKSQLGGSIWVEDSLNNGRIFDSRLTYDKGSAFIHTLRFLINNDSLFFECLKAYQNIYKGSTALGVDVQQTMENLTGLDLSAAFEQWYFGEGFPTYSAKWNVVGNDLYVKVTHTASMSSVTPTFTNPIEVRFTRSGMSDSIVRLDITSNDETFVLSNLANVTNLNAIDPANWVVNNVGSIQHDLNLGVNALSEEAEVLKLTVSPNPATDFITINAEKNQKYTLKVIDPKGHCVSQQTVLSGDKINVAQWSNGLYLLQFEAVNGEQIIRKLIRK